jgi:hypothetical protein
MTNCRRCHTSGTPLVPGAPFMLETYEQSQGLYLNVAIWARMKFVVERDFMPQEDPLLTPEEKNDLLDDWVCKCAPPRAESETCE